MATRLACAALGTLLLLAIATRAPASEAMTLADRAGFLIGHAQRCGIAEDRLEGSTERLTKLIAAFAADDADRDTAQARFAASITAAALAQLLGDKLPSCDIVGSTLVQFERHRQPMAEREGQMAANDRRGGIARRAASAARTPGKTAKRAWARPDELSAQRRGSNQARGKLLSI